MVQSMKKNDSANTATMLNPPNNVIPSRCIRFIGMFSTWMNFEFQPISVNIDSKKANKRSEEKLKKSCVSTNEVKMIWVVKRTSINIASWNMCSTWKRSQNSLFEKSRMFDKHLVNTIKNKNDIFKYIYKICRRLLQTLIWNIISTMYIINDRRRS